MTDEQLMQAALEEARIAAALKTNHNIGFRCLYIGNFPLTFVAPIGAHNCCYHK